MFRWIVLLLMLGSTAARADVTATYDLGQGMATIVIEAADNGSARATQRVSGVPKGPEVRFYSFPDGRDYMVWKQDDRWIVGRTEDLMALVLEAARGSGKLPQQHQNSPATPAETFVARGEEVIAGHSGKRYVLEKADGTALGFDLVISLDPALATIGRFFARSWANSFSAVNGIVGPMPPEFGQLKDLLAAGTLIRMGRIETLTKVETETIDPSTFVLPAEPASRDELRRLMSKPRTPTAPR